MSQQIGLSVASPIPEKRRSRQEAAPRAAAGVEGRRAGRGTGRGAGPGRGQEAAGERGPLVAAESTSPHLLRPLCSQFPPRPEMRRCARSACRWRSRGALGSLLGVGRGNSAPAGIPPMQGARAQQGGGERKAGGAATIPTAARTRRFHSSGGRVPRADLLR